MVTFVCPQQIELESANEACIQVHINHAIRKMQQIKESILFLLLTKDDYTIQQSIEEFDHYMEEYRDSALIAEQYQWLLDNFNDSIFVDKLEDKSYIKIDQ
jgi:hypothetical protein